MIGTRYSKWLGPINGLGGPQNITQTVNNISLADDDAILLVTTLTSGEVEDNDPDGQPDVCRVLSVTGNSANMDQPVFIIGTNWGGDRIAEKILLGGTATVNGKRPFASVSSIILPARNQVGETVKVGTANILGLYYPLKSQSDVLQQARAESPTSDYSFENVGGVDQVYASVDVGDTLQAGNSFQWQLLAPR